ncbi:MAG TPA: hypothetical protein GX515_11760 [Firmicutes bacterium]|nr:hypothetical protein [Bacillota bacterium]
MELARRARRWWHRQLIINPGRVDSWLVSLLSILATAGIVAVIVRFMG